MVGFYLKRNSKKTKKGSGLSYGYSNVVQGQDLICNWLQFYFDNFFSGRVLPKKKAGS